MCTRVVHVNDNIPDAVYIGRAMPRRWLKGSVFSNPFRIGATLPTFEGMDDRKATRSDVCAQYDLWFSVQRGLIRLLPELRGKPLACWCRHDGEPPTSENRCHGDILVEYLDAYTDDELIAVSEAKP